MVPEPEVLLHEVRHPGCDRAVFRSRGSRLVSACVRRAGSGLHSGSQELTVFTPVPTAGQTHGGHRGHFPGYFNPGFCAEMLVFPDDSGGVHEPRTKHDAVTYLADLSGLQATWSVGHRIRHKVGASQPSPPFPAVLESSGWGRGGVGQSGALGGALESGVEGVASTGAGERRGAKEALKRLDINCGNDCHSWGEPREEVGVIRA